MHEKVQEEVTEEGRRVIIFHEFHSDQQFMRDFFKLLFIAALVGVMEDLSPEYISLFLFDFGDLIRIILFDELFF